MESSSKRRKLDHSSFGLRQSALIDFESRDAGRLSTASIFTLQTDELLKSARVDYGKTLKDADSQLHRLKGIIDSIPTHDPMPVRQIAMSIAWPAADHHRFPKPRPSSRRSTTLSFPILTRSLPRMPLTSCPLRSPLSAMSSAVMSPAP